jgi:hypothetical protein
MKFETILALITEPRFRKILEDSSRTLHQRAADIAAIFHWPLAEIEALTLTDLIFWRSKALDRWNSMWVSQEKV